MDANLSASELILREMISAEHRDIERAQYRQAVEFHQRLVKACPSYLENYCREQISRLRAALEHL